MTARRAPVLLTFLLLVPFARPRAEDTAEDFEKSATRKLEAGDDAGAIADYDRALKLDPNFATAYVNRAAAKLDAGDFGGASADIDRAFNLGEDSSAAYINRSFVENQIGDYDGSMKDANKVLARDPKCGEAYFNRSYAKHFKGEDVGALADIDRAMELGPETMDVYLARGIVRAALGDARGAIEDETKEIALKPGYAGAYKARARARLLNEDAAGAAADAGKGVELAPDDWDAYFLRGMCEMTLGYDRAAAGDFDRAIGDVDFDMARASADSYASDLGRHQEVSAYYHFFRLIAMRRLHRPHPEEGLALASAKWEAGWTKTVALYLLGKMAEKDFLEQADAGDIKTKLGHQVEAFYYAGMTHLFKKDTGAAAALFEKSVATNQRQYSEFLLARIELSRLKPEHRP